jgi:hypothetical protein
MKNGYDAIKHATSTRRKRDDLNTDLGGAVMRPPEPRPTAVPLGPPSAGPGAVSGVDPALASAGVE